MLRHPTARRYRAIELRQHADRADGDRYLLPEPEADDESYRKAFRLSERAVHWIRSSTPESRSFLIKQGRDSVIAKLDLADMPDIIKVLSGRTETVAELAEVRARVGDDPAAWLPIFMGRGTGMKMVLVVLSSIVLMVIALPAFADIPTYDAAQLDQHSRTAATKIPLTPITTDLQNANAGVHCAVTTPKRADIINPTAPLQAGAGEAAIQPYSPLTPATPAPAATGGTLSSQTLFGSAGTVVGGVRASKSTLSAVRSNYQTMILQVGTAPTIQGAFDMNSAARVQNGLTWNNVIGSANLWLTAINAQNLAFAADMSLTAVAMRTSTPTPALAAPTCRPA